MSGGMREDEDAERRLREEACVWGDAKAWAGGSSSAHPSRNRLNAHERMWVSAVWMMP